MILGIVTDYLGKVAAHDEYEPVVEDCKKRLKEFARYLVSEIKCIRVGKKVEIEAHELEEDHENN